MMPNRNLQYVSEVLTANCELRKNFNDMSLGDRPRNRESEQSDKNK